MPQKPILHSKVQQFIQENFHADLNKLILSNRVIEGISAKEIAQQIDCKRRAEKKLPTWFATPNIIFPERINIEQTSSEITAQYKASLFSGNTLIDLSGGFGVDSYYFSKQNKKVIFCEQNEVLLEKVQHNFQVFGVKNVIFIAGNSLEHLSHSTEKYDCIYVDPARRNQEKKVFLLEDCEPNILENIALLLSKSDRILIKISPMFDCNELIYKLQYVKAIHCVAVKNEMKELLVEIEKKYVATPKIIAVNLETSHPICEFQLHDNQSSKKAVSLQKYLYEPNVSVLKAGAFNEISMRYDVKKLAANTHLYTADTLVSDFPGKIFEIENILKPQVKTLKKSLTESHYNLIVRNFPMKVSEIISSFKIKEGGEKYLIFTQLQKEKVVILANLVKMMSN